MLKLLEIFLFIITNITFILGIKYFSNKTWLICIIGGFLMYTWCYIRNENQLKKVIKKAVDNFKE